MASTSATSPSAGGSGRYILSFVAATTSIGCYIADFNETHVYNPTWPPHAKFHNGQTMSMGLLLGLLTLYYTWRPSYSHDSLLSACIIGALYWVTQLSAILYPGTSLVDPPVTIAPQPYICLTMFVMLGGAYKLEVDRLAAAGIGGAKMKGK